MRHIRTTLVLLGLGFAAACAPMETHEPNADGTGDVVLASQTPDRGPVAIELFTSQGCSSCPPADALIAELADDPDLVILTRPVTYWDRLGWRDTLAREENTQLQRRYAQQLQRGGGRAYTPQAVVNGRIGLVGSRRGELVSAVAEVRGNAESLGIDITGDRDAGYRVTISGRYADNATVRLLALDTSEQVAIGRGENTGRTVHYTNIVLAESDVAVWRNEIFALELGPEHAILGQGDRHAIVVRAGAAGPILAARYLDG